MSPPVKVTGPWRALVDHAGSVAALAREIGVSVRTLHRWTAGVGTPLPLVQEAVTTWAKRRGLASPFEGRKK